MSIKFEMIKEITKELKKEFKGIQANSYGYCCGSDYDAYHTYTNENDYVCCKIFKGGLNNQYHNGSFELGKSVWYMWHLTDFKLSWVINLMQRIAFKYGCIVLVPENDTKCIEIKVMEEE